MEIETNLISAEIIKPSSPTPKSLQKYHFSFLDQIAPPFIMPFVYFYSSNPTVPISQKSIHLKKSLSETLSTYYPLAGRLAGNLYVDCNDDGVPFSEVEANCNLKRITTKPNPENLKKFLPYKWYHENLDVCMAVQATHFRCGGISIGILMSHKIADAISLILFANTWSAVAKNGHGGGVPIPKFDAAARFPPKDISAASPANGMLNEEIATKIFSFSPSKIEYLRRRYSAASVELRRRPTRVEVLSAFLWTQFVSATGMKTDPNKIYNVQHPINLRSRVHPRKSEFHFGNILRYSMTTPTLGEDAVELLRKVQESQEGVNGEGLNELMDGEKYVNLIRERRVEDIKGELVSFSFTSLCRFPLYEADFGWGKPVWVGLPGFPHKNLVIFSDAKSGGGIDALIHMSKDDMEKFEADLEMQFLKSNL